MLFFSYFLTFSHPFFQLPNKFYNRKFQSINLKKQKSKQHHSLNSTVRSNWEREEERVIRNGGKGRDQSRWWVTTRGRRDRWWVTTTSIRSVLGGSIWGDAIFNGSVWVRSVWVDRSSVGCDWSRWIGLRWWCDLGGGARYMTVPVLGCDRWIGNSLFFLSLYLSLCASDSEMVWSENFHFKPFPGQSLILHGQLKIFSEKFIFHVQPNTYIYEKTFPEVIWSQNKHSLSVSKWLMLNLTHPIWEVLFLSKTITSNFYQIPSPPSTNSLSLWAPKFSKFLLKFQVPLFTILKKKVPPFTVPLIFWQLNCYNCKFFPSPNFDNGIATIQKKRNSLSDTSCLSPLL